MHRLRQGQTATFTLTAALARIHFESRHKRKNQRDRRELGKRVVSFGGTRKTARP